MRFLTSISIVLLLATGCVSNHPAPTTAQLSEKRQEIEILREEIPQVILQLEHFQRDLASQGAYPAEAQSRDLDYCISVLTQARDSMAHEYHRLHKQYGVSDNPDNP
jgi:hypothetical protein